MRHSVYCSCHQCNGVPQSPRVTSRRRHYANGTVPPAPRPAPEPLTQGLSDEDLLKLKEHFDRR